MLKILKKHFILCLTVTLILLGAITQYIPQTKINENLNKTCNPSLQEKYFFSQINHRPIDWYTDMAMLLVIKQTPASKPTYKNLFTTPIETIYTEKPNWGNIEPLKTLCNPKLPHFNTAYPRYWHGYQILLRPLFYFTDYWHILILNAILQTCLFIFMCLTMYKNKAKGLLPAWIFCYLIINPPATAANLTYSALYTITTIAGIIMLRLNKSLQTKSERAVFFAAIGIITAFFDFLTYPVVPLAILLTITFYQNPTHRFSEGFKRLIFFTASFLIGYIGMWCLKWGLSTLVSSNNVFYDAYITSLHRFEPKSAGKYYEIYQAPLIIWNYFLSDSITAVLLKSLGIISILILAWRYKKLIPTLKKEYHQLLIFLLISTSPVLYCLIIAGHPVQHAYYTWRLWLALLFPLITALSYFFTVPHKTTKRKH